MKKIVLERAAPNEPPVKITSEIFAELTKPGRGKFDDIHVRADASCRGIPRDEDAANQVKLFISDGI